MSKVRDLPETTTLSDNDLVYAVDVSEGPNGGRKITKANLKESVKQSPAEVKEAYESNADTNAFTDAEKAKLAGIEAGATADQVASEVPYDNEGGELSATNVQDAIDELGLNSQADFRPTVVSGRILHYTGGTARFDDAFFRLLPGDILLNTNVTNGEVYVDVDGIVKQTGSGVTSPPLTIVFAKFTTDLDNILSLSDERVKNTQNLVRGSLSDVRDVRAGAASSAGSSGRVSDAQHKHNVLTGVAITILPDQANAEGTAAELARRDHVHLIPTASAVGLSATTANGQGTAATFALSDHTHAIATGVVSTQLPDQANAAGTSANVARADHVHNIPAAIVISVGAANAKGTSANFSLADHVHQGVHSIKANSGSQRYNDVSLVNGYGVTVTDDGSGNFTVDTNAGANEFVVTGTSGLTVSYKGGRFANGRGGEIVAVPDGSVAVPDNSTGWIYVRVNLLNQGAATVVASTTRPGTSDLPFVKFVSSAGNIIATSDVRVSLPTIPVNSSLRVSYSGTGLTVDYNSGNVRINGTHASVSAGSLVLSNGVATGAIYVDVDGVVKANGTGTFPSNCVPMATYTTTGGAVTAIGAARIFLQGNVTFGLVGDIVTIVPNAAATAGATNRYADAGHTHAIATAAAVSQAPDQANAEGNASSFARSNHVHQIPTAAAVTLSATTTNTQGTGVAFARNDHTHAISTGVVSTQLPDQANAAGTSANLARADHVHLIPTATAVSLTTSSTNGRGSAATFALSDHTHSVSIDIQQATATADDNTTSVTDVLMVGMTLTPAAGTYLVNWNGSIVNSANGAERTFASIYAGGSQVTASERGVGTSGGAYAPTTLQTQVTVNGSQAIEVRWRVAGGTSTVRQRRLGLTKVSN